MKEFIKNCWGKLHRDKDVWRLSHIFLICVAFFVLGCVSGCSSFNLNKEKVKQAVVRGNLEVLLDDQIIKCNKNKSCLKKLEKRIQTPMKKERFVSCYDKKKEFLGAKYKKITLKVCE